MNNAAATQELLRASRQKVESNTIAIRIAEPCVVLRGGADRPRRRRRAATTDSQPAINASQISNVAPSRARLDVPGADLERSAATDSAAYEADDGSGHPADTEPAQPSNREDEFPPAILRGLLTLTVVKPLRVRKIDLRIRGLCRTEWPEGIGPRRLEVSEESVVMDETFTYFNAADDTSTRRAASTNPGGYENDDRGRPLHRAASHWPAVQDESGSSFYGSRDIRNPLSQSTASSADYDLAQVASRNSHDEGWAAEQRITDSPLSSPGVHTSNGQLRTSTSASRAVSSRSVSRPATPHAASIPTSSDEGSPAYHDRNEMPGIENCTEQAVNGHRPSPTPREASRSKTPTRPKMRAQTTDDREQHSRFSLAAIGDALRNKGKNRDADSRRADQAAEPVRSTARSASRGRSKGLKAIKDALTASVNELGKHDNESDEEEEHHGKAGWREFKPGTYSWTITIPLSIRLPPTVTCGFGQTSYRLRATVRRPGALTSNIVAETDLDLVAAPGDDDTEDSESIVVERMWETQLSYLIAVNQKSFPVGGSVPITIRLRPLAKIKVYRISVFLEEKVVYFALSKKLQRSENVRRVTLAKLCYDEEDKPLLPILSEDPDAIAKSPLAPWFINPTSSDDTTPSCLDPIGPWELEAVLKVPGSDSRLKFTTTNAKSSIHITHVLKVVVRVDRGDDSFLDAKGKRKKWDIIVEATVHLLSYRCSQTLLPAYSRVSVSPAPTVQPSNPTAGHRPRRDMSGYDPAAALAFTVARPSQSPADDVTVVVSAEDPISPPSYSYSMSHPQTAHRPEVLAQVLSTRNSTDSERSSAQSHEQQRRKSVASGSVEATVR